MTVLTRAQKANFRLTPEPEAPKRYAEGFAVVVGPRAVLARYWTRPWRDVVAAAKCGSDGLIFTDETTLMAQPLYHGYNIPADHFALREAKSLLRGSVTTLWLQNWNW